VVGEEKHESRRPDGMLTPMGLFANGLKASYFLALHFARLSAISGRPSPSWRPNERV